jgi:hypothetical protein
VSLKIFGREPALWLGTIGAVIAWAATLNLEWLNAGQAVALITFITGVVMALTTRPVAPGLFVAVVAAGASLAAEYGLHWSDAQVTAVGTAILAAFALFGVRPQVTPVADQAPTALSTGQVR